MMEHAKSLLVKIDGVVHRGNRGARAIYFGGTPRTFWLRCTEEKVRVVPPHKIVRGPLTCIACLAMEGDDAV